MLMTRLLVFGQPYWARQIVAAVNRHARHLRRDLRPSERLPTAARASASRATDRGSPMRIPCRQPDLAGTPLRRVLGLARFAACPMRYGATTGSVRTSCTPSKTMWARGAARPDALRRAMDDLHFADAPWLADELRTIDIEATVSIGAGATPDADRATTDAPDFSVLTYLPRERFEFYGGALVLEAASQDARRSLRRRRCRREREWVSVERRLGRLGLRPCRSTMLSTSVLVRVRCTMASERW